MFLRSDTNQQREAEVREHLDSAPSISLVLAAINFEWTVSRAVLFLSASPNRELRAAMKDFRSLDGYKELWKQLERSRTVFPNALAPAGALRVTRK